MEKGQKHSFYFNQN